MEDRSMGSPTPSAVASTLVVSVPPDKPTPSVPPGLRTSVEAVLRDPSVVGADLPLLVASLGKFPAHARGALSGPRGGRLPKQQREYREKPRYIDMGTTKIVDNLGR